ESCRTRQRAAVTPAPLERRPVWLPSPGRPSAACVGRARRSRPRRTASTTAANTPARARLGSHLSALARSAKPVGVLGRRLRNRTEAFARDPRRRGNRAKADGGSSTSLLGRCRLFGPDRLGGGRSVGGLGGLEG